MPRTQSYQVGNYSISDIKPKLQDADSIISDLPDIDTVDQNAIEEGALQVKSIKNQITFKKLIFGKKVICAGEG